MNPDKPPHLPNPFAFPRPAFHPSESNNRNWSFNNRSEDGMSLREFYAGIAMLAYLAVNDSKTQPEIAGAAFNMADEMLRARISTHHE